jgi:hypothetical protein
MVSIIAHIAGSNDWVLGLPTQSYQNFISTVSVYSHERGILLRMQPMSNKKISEVA